MQSDFDRHLAEMASAIYELREINCRLERVIAKQEQGNWLLIQLIQAVAVDVPPDLRSLNAQAGQPVNETQGGFPMPVNIPVGPMLDTEKLPLSVMPRKADGHVDNAATVSWLSSAEAEIGVEVGTEPFDFVDEKFSETVTCPGNFNAFATTPGTNGSLATVTVSAAGYDSAVFGPFVYAPGVARSLNASVGTAVSDAEVAPS